MKLPAQEELTPAWRDICAQVRGVVGDDMFEIWLSPVSLKAWDGTTLVLEAPAATRSWVMRRFGRVLEQSVRRVIGESVVVVFDDGTLQNQMAMRSGGSQSSASAETLNPRFSFDQFIIGLGNRIAHSAALAVAENPGHAYNPLFLYGPPGLGKSHLLHAIGNYVLAFSPGTRVRYTTVESFTNHFITALGSKAEIEQFKRAYRDADVLLIDDVQFLAAKAKTEEEFFHTFNALHENGRQLVLTCDRLPRQLTGIEERLRERFEAGLVARLAPPDHGTRRTIVRKRAALDGIAVEDPAVFELIAERVTDNIRSLQGALIRIVANHSFDGKPLNLDLARSVLDEIHPSRGGSSPTIAAIQTAVADHFGLSVKDLCSASRAAPVTLARQVAIYLVRELTDKSLEAIGAAFGGRNHATVLHACKRVGDRMVTEPEVTADVESLLGLFRGQQADRGC